MEEKAYLWTLGRLKTISTKTENQSTSIAIYINTWKKIANGQKMNKIIRNTTNVTKWNILPKTIN